MVEPAPVTEHELRCGRVAAALVAVESAAIAALTIYYLVVVLGRPGADVVMVVMSAIMLAIFAVALGYVATGLWARHPRAQAPALAMNILAIPLGSVLYAFTHWSIATGVLVVAVVIVVTGTLMGQPGRDRPA